MNLIHLFVNEPSGRGNGFGLPPHKVDIEPVLGSTWYLCRSDNSAFPGIEVTVQMIERVLDEGTGSTDMYSVLVITGSESQLRFLHELHFNGPLAVIGTA